MNFAFPALLIFLLTLPGLILRYTYTRGFFGTRSPVSFRPVTDEIGYSVVIAAVLHIVWSSMVLCFGFSIDVQSTMILLMGAYGKNNEFLDHAIASLSDSSHHVVTYFLTLYGASAGFGYLAHYIVRRFRLDWRFPFFRFRNEWYYLLTGEIRNHGDWQERIHNDGTYMSGIVHHGDKSYLYRGIVADFYFDNSGNLDRILLVEAQRREIAADRPRSERRQLPPADDPR